MIHVHHALVHVHRVVNPRLNKLIGAAHDEGKPLSCWRLGRSSPIDTGWLKKLQP